MFPKIFPKIAKTAPPSRFRASARQAAAIVALTGSIALGATPAAGQAPAAKAPATVEQNLRARQVAPQPTVMTSEDPNADRTRDQLMQLFEKYPPSVARVLKLDPSLLANGDYLATYPALNSFLVQHPEVTRSPGYYLERISTGNTQYVENRSNTARLMEDALSWMAGLTVASLIVFSLGWAIRTFLDYRRWLRLSRIQTETHTKLLDRMGSNEEMLAYVKSPAGARFLESAPISLDSGPARRIAAPYSRILWSIQAGVVVLVAGIGLRIVAASFVGVEHDDEARAFGVFGILAMSIGIGFVLSALISFVLSRKLGLFDDPQAPAPRTMPQE